VTPAIFGWAISGDSVVAIVISVLVAAYLVYALIKPENL